MSTNSQLASSNPAAAFNLTINAFNAINSGSNVVCGLIGANGNGANGALISANGITWSAGVGPNQGTTVPIQISYASSSGTVYPLPASTAVPLSFTLTDPNNIIVGFYALGANATAFAMSLTHTSTNGVDTSNLSVTALATSTPSNYAILIQNHNLPQTFGLINLSLSQTSGLLGAPSLSWPNSGGNPIQAPAIDLNGTPLGNPASETFFGPGGAVWLNSNQVMVAWAQGTGGISQILYSIYTVSSNQWSIQSCCIDTNAQGFMTTAAPSLTMYNGQIFLVWSWYPQMFYSILNPFTGTGTQYTAVPTTAVQGQTNGAFLAAFNPAAQALNVQLAWLSNTDNQTVQSTTWVPAVGVLGASPLSAGTTATPGLTATVCGLPYDSGLGGYAIVYPPTSDLGTMNLALYNGTVWNNTYLSSGNAAVYAPTAADTNCGVVVCWTVKGDNLQTAIFGDGAGGSIWQSFGSLSDTWGASGSPAAAGLYNQLFLAWPGSGGTGLYFAIASISNT